MPTLDFRHLVQAKSALLGPGLYEGLATAVDAAGKRARGLEHAQYPFVRPQLTRVELRQHLATEGLPSGWHLAGDSRLMGQLFLDHSNLRLRLRFLKERRRTYPGGVPTAGHNHARRNYWQAPLFPLSMQSESVGPLRQLLLLWDYAPPPTASTDEGNVVERDTPNGRRTLTAADITSGRAAFSLRIVHTIEAGVYGNAVRCDLNLLVQAGGAIFEDLEFAGSEEEEDFFEVEIDKDENES